MRLEFVLTWDQREVEEFFVWRLWEEILINDGKMNKQICWWFEGDFCGLFADGWVD
jgi:hypothetical protein